MSNKKISKITNNFNEEEQFDRMEQQDFIQEDFGGKINISEEVIAQLAVSSLSTIEGIFPSNPGLIANLRLGRKTMNGIRVSISESEVPEIIIDVYALVKYGVRIPDICWDAQESIKKHIESLTGHNVKNVNIYVQGIAFSEDILSKSEQEEECE